MKFYPDSACEHPRHEPAGLVGVVLTGEDLGMDEIIRVAQGAAGAESAGGLSYPHVVLAPAVADRLRSARDRLEATYLDDPEAPPAYGINTGCGDLKNYRLSRDQIAQFNSNYIRSHCTGVGDALPVDVVRAAIVLRANQLARGHSGLRPEVVQALIDLLNHRITPIVPQSGSLGASGDLAPLSHIAAVIIGHESARVSSSGEVMTAAEALQRSGLVPLVLGAKEGMALNNGSTVALAWDILLIRDAEHLLEVAEVAAALSLEAMRAEAAAFDPRVHRVRGGSGQRLSAERIRRLTRGSGRMTEATRQVWLGRPDERPCVVAPRVQDAYSLRCIPQVHGAAYEAIAFLRGAVEADINSATDNPLVFLDETGMVEVLSGGNFFGQHQSLATDTLAIALAKLAQISERRTFRLLNPSLSFQLPEQLSGGRAGLNSGLMIAQYTQASLVNEILLRTAPASVLGAITSGGQEDLCSMALAGASKAAEVLDRLAAVLGIELVAAAQGITLTQARLGQPRLGDGTAAALGAVRMAVAELGDDRFLHDDLVRAIDLVRGDRLVRVVRDALAITDPPRPVSHSAWD